MPWASTLPKESACRAATSLIVLPPLALPSSGSSGRRKAPSQPAPPMWLRELPSVSDLTGALCLAPWRGQQMGHDPIHLGIQRQSEVAAIHLDRVEIVAQACLPVHDSVRARIDR